jgi:hypothetical protein
MALTDDDLRAAVAAGILSEAQAARTLTLSQTRAGRRAALTGNDEPFEMFRGFSEIFISVGLVLLISGLTALSALAGNGLIVGGFGVVLSWGLALYFTRRRRMVLPSMVLVTGFAMAWFGLIAATLDQFGNLQMEDVGAVLLVGGLMAAGLLGWYAAFKVPFTMFILGLTVLGVILFLTTTIRADANMEDLRSLFDLRQGSGLAIGTLVFGVLAFLAAMVFDLRDPHRLGRMAASGFWLHLLAAPALVNTVALSLWDSDAGTGLWPLAGALVMITLLALIIDRRSFLTAAIGYFGVLLALIVDVGNGGMNWAWLLVLLGGFVTAVGAGWNRLRAGLLRALPDFPGKDRLPPYD